MRLKTKEIQHYRARLLKEQNGICALCETPIRAGDDTLDHCHATGHVRRVLCRTCNGAEGRVLSWAKRVPCNPLLFLSNLAKYWQDDYTRNPFHPMHLTETEKEIKKLRKRMNKVKRSRTKQKYKDKINALKEGV